MKILGASLAALVVFGSPLALAQAPAKATPRPVPTHEQSGAGITVKAGSEAPEGTSPARVQDFRYLDKDPNDPFALERLGLGAVQANDLAKARVFFERAWKLGQLPTAAYNLACVDAREKKVDAAFASLNRALAAGFDDERSLKTDSDLAPLRESPRFQVALDAARKNRAAGDVAAVKEGLFVAPKRKPAAILVLLHDAASSPMAVSAPFVAEADRRGLFLAVPRGPGRSADKRFGWGSAERAAAAVDAVIAEARRRARDPKLPVFLLGAGRGGTEAFTVAARKPAGAVAGVGSIGGPFDPGAAQQPAGLRGVRLFCGIARDAAPAQAGAFRRGVDALRRNGLSPTVVEWPGAGASFPKDVPKAVSEALDGMGLPPGR
jgi:hypothetical protein